MDELGKIYYNLKNPAGYASIKKLQEASPSSKNVPKWLSGERTYTLHKPLRKRLSKYRSYKAPFFKYQFQADLNDMQKFKDRGFKYILTVIDLFTRYAWAVPLKKKTGQEVTKAFKTHIPTPMYLQVDQGKEFYNSTFKQYLNENNIKMFSVNSPQKAAMVERFNRTLKTKMFKYFTKTNKNKWVNVLPELVESYNNSKHRILKMTPTEALNKENQMHIWEMKNKRVKSSSKAKFKPNDYVRIARLKGLFDKGYTKNWSEEIFQIDSIDESDTPVMYNIKDMDNDLIIGKFYNEELQKIEVP